MSMNREVVWVDGAIPDLFHQQARGLCPGYSRSLEVVYTNGKSGEWRTAFFRKSYGANVFNEAKSGSHRCRF
jgi:hypothetical protein